MMGVGVQQHEAVGHDADVAFPEHQIAALQIVELLADRHGVADLGLLHVAVARAGVTGRLHGDLNEARAVDPEARLAAPNVGDAGEAFGDGDEVGGVARALDDVAGRHMPAVGELGERRSLLGDRQRGGDADVHPRRRFDVGLGVEEGADRAHHVRRLLDLVGKRALAQVADVVVTLELHPGPAVLLLVDGDDLAEQCFRGPAGLRIGAVAQLGGGVRRSAGAGPPRSVAL